MLITFTVENWRSFRDPAVFSMVASKEQQHGERLVKLGKYRMRVLPSAVICGGNASGKTNFFMAISFAKNFILRGSQPDALIAQEPFQLDEECRKEPSWFIFEILIEDDIYELSFSITSSKVIEEKLIRETSGSEKVLYHRRVGDPNPHFHSSIDNQRLQFTFEGTQDNQLFLTNSVSQKIEEFKAIYDWFYYTLVLIAPDTRFASFEQFVTEGSHLYKTMNAILPSLDTGIEKLGGEEVPFDLLDIPEMVKQDIKETVKNGSSIKINDLDERIVVSRKDDVLTAKKLCTWHYDKNGKGIKFEMKQESDGAKRIIDLLPAFLDLGDAPEPRVYIIDEIDRSLHSLLIRQLLEMHLSNCSDATRKQLLFTTHDLI